jgi:hypothetical protein
MRTQSMHAETQSTCWRGAAYYAILFTVAYCDCSRGKGHWQAYAALTTFVHSIYTTCQQVIYILPASRLRPSQPGLADLS